MWKTARDDQHTLLKTSRWSDPAQGDPDREGQLLVDEVLIALIWSDAQRKRGAPLPD